MRWVPDATMPTVQVVYKPLVELQQRSPAFDEALNDYCDWWFEISVRHRKDEFTSPPKVSPYGEGTAVSLDQSTVRKLSISASRRHLGVRRTTSCGRPNDENPSDNSLRSLWKSRWRGDRTADPRPNTLAAHAGRRRHVGRDRHRNGSCSNPPVRPSSPLRVGSSVQDARRIASQVKPYSTREAAAGGSEASGAGRVQTGASSSPTYRSNTSCGSKRFLYDIESFSRIQ